MARGNQFFSDPLTTTYDSEVYPLGTVRYELAEEVVAGGRLTSGSSVSSAVTFSLLQGDREWVFVRCNASTAIVAGDLCKISANGTPNVIDRDAGSETSRWLLRGVADHDIAVNYYGWIIRKGACVVQTKAGVTAGNLLASDGDNTAGEVDVIAGTNAGDSNSIVGYALEAVSATATGFAQAMVDFNH